jgi:hypothetical protein
MRRIPRPTRGLSRQERERERKRERERNKGVIILDIHTYYIFCLLPLFERNIYSMLTV